jgi:hypothetical protein
VPRRVSILAVSLLLTWAGSVRAEPGLVVGVTEDGLKFEPEAALADGRKLGVEAFRITLRWRPGLTAPTAAQAAELKRATGSASSVSIVLSVFGERAVYAPTTTDRREAYCAFLAQIVRSYERIRYITIWNEPNKTFFWRPQFNPDGTSAAPGAYEELLARCWDALHEARSDVKVVAPSTAPRGNDNPDAASNVSHSPTAFVRELGRVYRASGRDAPIFDVVGHHVHAIDSAERPWRQHPGSGVTQGDLKKLEQAFSEAFAGTAQPYPGHCIDEKCVPVWWLEAGFQTTPDPNKTSLYGGFEISPRPVPDSTGDVELEPLPDSRSLAPDQATQIVSALRLAYCQPHVEAFFNFLLWDEQRLEGWQSAPYWFDRSPKGSFGAFRSAIREIKRGRVECDSLIAASQTPNPAAKAGAGGSTAPGSTTPNSAQTPAQAAAKDTEGSGEDGLWPWLVAAGGAALLLAAAGLAYLLRRRSGATGGRPRGDSR